MAAESVGALYIRLGLNLSDLETGFIAADRTVTENVNRLNRERNLIRIRSKIELSGLDEATDAQRIFEVRTNSLNQQLSIQRDRVNILSAALQDLTATHGEDSRATQQATLQLERERLAAARLEQELRQLNTVHNNSSSRHQNIISLGVDISALESGLSDANQTVRENLNRLNQEGDRVRIRSQIEILGLDSVANAEEILSTRANALNQQLSIQRDRVRILSAEVQSLTSTQGESAGATQQAITQLERERLRVAQLENELRNLQNTIQSNSTQSIVSLGVDVSALESGLAEASQTVQENLTRLSRESERIRIRSQIEITGLDSTADAERILSVRINALNQQLSIQRDRVRILSTELNHLTTTQGANANATQQVQTQLERERLALAQLERELRNLQNANTNTNDSTNQSVSIFEELGNLLPEIPTKMQAIGIAAGALASGVGVATASIKEMIEDFRELQKQSYELNMSVNDTEQFLRELKLAGGDIGDFEGYIRGITDAYVKGEVDDPEFIALSKYGAKITDITGKLKDFAAITEEVYQAWKKADAAGEGIEFLQLTGGEAGVRDAIQYFKRLEEAREDALKIYDANLDGSELHEMERALNLVAEQSRELKNALGNIFTPAVTEAAEKLFEKLHDGTEILVENKDKIQEWGEVAVAVFSKVSEKLSELTSFREPNTSDENVNKILSGQQWLTSAFNEQGLWGDNSLVGKAYSTFFSDLGISLKKYTSDVEKATTAEEIFSDAVEETDEKQNSLSESLREGAEEVKEYGDVLSQYGAQRVKEFKDELADLEIELDFADDEYGKALAELDLWKDRELTDKLYVSNEERLAIEELYSAKLEQIEQERADKIAEIYREVTSANQTELEKRMSAIEEAKEKWISVGMDAAEAEKLAEQQKADYIAGVERELSTSLQSLYQTELENRLSQIDKEKQAWIDKCGDEVKATQLAEQAKVDAQRNAAMSVIKQQAEEYEAYQKGGYGGLRAYKAAKLQEQGVNLDYLYMTPQQLAEFQKANQVADKSMMPNFMTDHDRAEHAEQMQNWNAWQSQRNAEYDAQNYAIFGDKKVSLRELLGGNSLEFDIGKNDNGEKHSIKVSDDGNSYTRTDKKYSYDKDGRLSQEDTTRRRVELPTIAAPSEGYNPEDYSELPQAFQNVAESLSEMPEAVKAATESLNELPSTIQEVAETLSNIPEVEASEIPDVDSSVISEVMASLSELPTPIQSVTESLTELSSGNLSEFTQAVSGTTESLNEIPQAVLGVSEQISNIVSENNLPGVLSELEQSFSQIPTAIQTATESFGELPTAISSLKENLATEFSQLFSPMTETLSEVTIAINDFATSIGNFLNNLMTDLKTNSEQKQPVNVNTTVQIDEAHAWDYDHIQELADEVAAMITPEIIKAVGGDSNSY